MELATVVALLSFVAAGVAPSARRWSERAGAIAAREAVAGLIAEARVAGLGRGGARVHLTDRPWRAWSEVGGQVLREVAVERDFTTVVALSRGRSRTTLEYDALGLGRIANETLVFRRGNAETALVISGYGRVRRR